MDVVQIREILRSAMALRFPQWNPEMHPNEKIGALEDYLGKTAIHRGELESALYWAREAEKILLDRWQKVEGWEAVQGRRETNQSVDDAKRILAPDVWEGLDEARRLIHDLGRQIRRLERDYEAVSRDYTLITGG